MLISEEVAYGNEEQGQLQLLHAPCVNVLGH